MNSRFRFALVATFLVALTLTGSAFALERSVMRAGPDDADPWRGGAAPCTVTYYNSCVGWLWTWSGWSPNDIIGVNYASCCAVGQSNLTQLDFRSSTASPPGYGYTGAVDVWAADGNGCPTGASLSNTPLLLIDGWQTIDYSTGGGVTVPASFVVTYTFGPGSGNPTRMLTDYDAAGPTGPQGCGLCFPTTRVVRSYYYGITASPLCPGSTLSGGICDVEWLFSIGMECVTSVESSSWGAVKDLYR